jgi:alpha-N-arabinofuranosidase
MYAAHQGARAVRSVFTAPEVSYSRNGKPATLVGLCGSASLDGKRLTLTATNLSLDRACEAEIAIHGGAARAITTVTLAERDVHAHNTFENPDAVKPATASLTAKGSLVRHSFPPASVTKLEIELG